MKITRGELNQIIKQSFLDGGGKAKALKFQSDSSQKTLDISKQQLKDIITTAHAQGQKYRHLHRPKPIFPIIVGIVVLVGLVGVLWRIYTDPTLVASVPILADIFPTPAPTSTPQPKSTPTPTPVATPIPTPTPTVKKSAPTPTPAPSLPTGNTQDDGCRYAQMTGISSPMDCNQFKDSRGMDFVFGCGNCVVAGGNGGNANNDQNSNNNSNSPTVAVPQTDFSHPVDNTQNLNVNDLLNDVPAPSTPNPTSTCTITVQQCQSNCAAKLGGDNSAYEICTRQCESNPCISVN